jgi:hypothetical protein
VRIENKATGAGGKGLKIEIGAQTGQHPFMGVNEHGVNGHPECPQAQVGSDWGPSEIGTVLMATEYRDPRKKRRGTSPMEVGVALKAE